MSKSAIYVAAQFVLLLCGTASAQTVPAALVTDPSGQTIAATVQGQSTTNAGPSPGTDALSLSGAGCADIPFPIVDTSQSFTVSAWVRVNQPGGYQTFASIDGGQTSGFFLQLRGDTHSFAMNVIPSDQRKPAGNAESIAEVKPGVWYWLVGDYDSHAKTVSLYVDGVLQETVPFNYPWKASGHTEIGRGQYNGNQVDWVKGDIAQVQFYSGVHLDQGALDAMAQQTLSAPANLNVDLTAPGPAISPTLYGMMIEDINHGIDGGLYAELIRNRAFKDDPNKPADWSVVDTAGGSAAISLDTTQPVPSTALTTSLRLDTGPIAPGARAGIANDGYWGVPVTLHTRYHASFYAKAATGFTGPVMVDLETTDGNSVWASAKVADIGTDWKQYNLTLNTGDAVPSEANRLVLSTTHPGTLWFTQVSLFPPTFKNRPNGTRPDLMKLMGAMHPAFLRMPGGNYLEGNTIAERFEWKNAIHYISQRPGHQDPWGYRSSDGFGLLEYLEWCEDLHMQPLLAVFAGYALGGEHVDAGVALRPFVQDALDEIQYVTGDASTPFGAMRAADGHPAPFPLTYVEVGNEDFFDRSGSYEGRFAQFYDAIRAAYPNLKIIATTKVATRTPDVYDDHYYPSPAGFETDTHHYDGYDRKGPKIFVGEYASQEGHPTPDMNAALGDASWMTGLERNGDLVVMASYAPLLTNISPGAGQWGVNLIGFDGLTSYGSPSYYVQKLFSLYRADNVAPGTLDDPAGGLYFTSGTSGKDRVILKVVNANAFPRTVTISLNTTRDVRPAGDAITLSSANRTDTNTISDPDKIVPVETQVSGVARQFQYTFKPLSVTVLVVRLR